MLWRINGGVILRIRLVTAILDFVLVLVRIRVHQAKTVVASLSELRSDRHGDVILALVLLPSLPGNHGLESIDLLQWRCTCGNTDLTRILSTHQPRLFPTHLV